MVAAAGTLLGHGHLADQHPLATTGALRRGSLAQPFTAAGFRNPASCLKDQNLLSPRFQQQPVNLRPILRRRK
ncbi:hypothetical protein Dimus_022026, partial [Dionaea muscipula]